MDADGPPDRSLSLSRRNRRYSWRRRRREAGTWPARALTHVFDWKHRKWGSQTHRGASDWPRGPTDYLPLPRPPSSRTDGEVPVCPAIDAPPPPSTRTLDESASTSRNSGYKTATLERYFCIIRPVLQACPACSPHSSLAPHLSSRDLGGLPEDTSSTMLSRAFPREKLTDPKTSRSLYFSEFLAGRLVHASLAEHPASSIEERQRCPIPASVRCRD